MATSDDTIGDIVEECTECERPTPHNVGVKILAESTAAENSAFSREPYRVSECKVCGATTRIRMNNA